MTSQETLDTLSDLLTSSLLPDESMLTSGGGRVSLSTQRLAVSDVYNSTFSVGGVTIVTPFRESGLLGNYTDDYITLEVGVIFMFLF